MAGEAVLRPMAEPMRMAAIEIAELARMSEGLQSLIARLAACEGPPPVALLVEAQSADLLSQRLAGLAAFLDALADGAPPDAKTDVSRAVFGLMLAEQARRLSGAPPEVHCAAAAEADGELFLFGD